MRLLTGHRHAVRALAYAPNDPCLLATSGDDRSVRLWNPSSGEAVAAYESPRDGVLCLGFSPNGKYLASGGRAGFLTVWQIGTADPLWHLGCRCPGPIAGLSFTVEGRAILLATRSQTFSGECGSLLCRNIDPVFPSTRLDWTGDIERAAVAPGRHLLAVAGLEGELRLLPVGRDPPEPFARVGARVRACAFSPDEKRLAVSTGRTVRLYDMEAAAWVADLAGARGIVEAVAFTPDGRGVLAGGSDGAVHLFAADGGRRLASWNWGLGGVHALAISPDGMTAAAGGNKSTVVVWDIDEEGM